jgi:cellulose synthase/poly-beta-1,6-N-acetylglucosamine synthase-like glycosyltransferase
VLWPKITVVFNQGKFLEQTILSVVGQDYPNLEYFVFDGGSTDESLEVIHQYEAKITAWKSEADGGRTPEKNRLYRACGRIWLFPSSGTFLAPSIGN